MRRLTAVIFAATLGGCSTVAAYQPQPLVGPDGRLGFSANGIASYTSDRAKAEQQIRELLIRSCGGPIELTSLSMQDASSPAGVPHIAYRATAICLQ